MKKALVFLFVMGSLMLISFGGTGGCGGAATDGEDDGGGGGDFAGTWTYVELLDSLAPAESLCPCGTLANSEIDSNDPNDCGPRKYFITFDVDSSGNVTIQGTDDSWGKINTSGEWSGSPEEDGYINAAVSGTCTSTSCSGTFTTDYVTGSGGVADCYDGTFTMTKN